jgi:hypothetical protein
VVSILRYRKAGKDFKNFSLLKYTLACAVAAVSLVSSGVFPVNKDLTASNLQTMAANKGVTFLLGGFLLNAL